MPGTNVSRTVAALSSYASEGVGIVDHQVRVCGVELSGM